jgi:hypothetical protein
MPTFTISRSDQQNAKVIATISDTVSWIEIYSKEFAIQTIYVNQEPQSLDFLLQLRDACTKVLDFYSDSDEN